MNNENISKARYWRDQAHLFRRKCSDIGHPVKMTEFERSTGLKGDPWRLDPDKNRIGCDNTNSLSKYLDEDVFDPNMELPK